jgi:hypothetical protein
MWPVSVRSPLSAEDEEWQLETWRWLLEQLGGLDDLHAKPLVTPTREFFPPTDATGHARAESVFQSIKQQMGLQEWPCLLLAQPPTPDFRVSDVVHLKTDKGALNQGTFGIENEEPMISYDPNLVGDPLGLVAVLAHELSHYLLFDKGDPPGGHEYHEYATELTVTYTGFGIFGLCAAYRFIPAYGANSYSGYLSQREWAFALAVFFALRGQPIEDARPWLQPHLMNIVQRSAKYLAKNPAKLEPLRRVTAARQPT